MSDAKPKPVRDPKKEIVMKKVEGTIMLKDCYFYPTDVQGIFLLSNKDDETLAVVTSGQPFLFEHDGFLWKVPNPDGSEKFFIDREFASGSFWNNAPIAERSNAPGYDAEEGGTFTAQASGGPLEEDASAASAGAY